MFTATIAQPHWSFKNGEFYISRFDPMFENTPLSAALIAGAVANGAQVTCPECETSWDDCVHMGDEIRKLLQ